MREIINFSINDIIINKDIILEQQGIPIGSEISPKINMLFENAKEIFFKLSTSIGIITDIRIDEFEIIYNGEGLNEKPNPLSKIYPKADKLALFVITLGEKINQKINQLFKSNNLALGYMLDTIASEGIEKIAEILDKHFFNIQSIDKQENMKILRYSPGYCGWDVSGQKKLFDFLHPIDIGISLNDSFLMQPLKSISGIIISGKREIHNFENVFSFCNQCKTHNCRERIKN